MYLGGGEVDDAKYIVAFVPLMLRVNAHGFEVQVPPPPTHTQHPSGCTLLHQLPKLVLLAQSQTDHDCEVHSYTRCFSIVCLSMYFAALFCILRDRRLPVCYVHIYIYIDPS